MKLRQILCALCLLVPACLLAQEPIKKPNIIFILADDMGYSDMSWQGSNIETPNLDKLRSDGMFLERNYVQPQCSPSRVAFLTGNYPYRYGLQEHIILPWSLTGIPNEEKTIAEKMHEAGYETAIVGKWHVGSALESYLPQHQEFDHSTVCINGSISYWNYTHYGRSDIIKDGVKYYAPKTQDNEASGNQYVTNVWRDEAIKIIEQKDKNKPLFLYLSFTAPHHPLQATKETADKYKDIEVDEYWPSTRQKNNIRFHKSRRDYMALVDDMDQAIGRVIKTLKDQGIYDNTLIVFSSDNGGIAEADNGRVYY